MLKLIKYEFRKTWFTKLILLGITAVVEVIFLIGLYAEKEGMLAMSIGLLMTLAFGGVLVIGIQSVLTLHRDMNTKQSYMLFMTPHSSYSILGAKVLENGLSMLLTGAFFFALGMLVVTLLLAKSGELKDFWNMVQDFLKNFTIDGRELRFDAGTLATFFFSLLAGWFSAVMTAYLADVVSSALLNAKRFNGLVSFILFIALSWMLSYVAVNLTRSIQAVQTAYLVEAAIYMALSVVMYIVTAQIMERKLSV